VSQQPETAAMVALLRSGTLPWQRYADLVEEAGTAVRLLADEASHTGDQTTLFAPDAERLMAEAQAEVDGWQAAGIDVLTVLDDGYPDNLRTVHDRPPLVFVAGRLLPADAKSLAVIGSRTATPTGIEIATEIAIHLLEAEYTVVSGLAAGIDTAAHTAALRRGGRTVAVIGTGLEHAYPAENAKLQAQIADAGAVVSQFWPDAKPSRRSFPMRNGVMSGLTLGSIVVEASQTSGARLQARLALAHGRLVFLHQTLVKREPWAREFAARPGTHVFDRPDQITEITERLTAESALVE
jgi:DNA processing protein